MKKPAPAPEPPAESHLQSIASLCTTLVTGLFVLTFIFQNFAIPSASMASTLLVGDHVIVDRASLAPPASGPHILPYRPLRRGEPVVLFKPVLEPDGTNVILVKRVIGLPGETISLSGNGYVLINGKRLDETWLPTSVQGTTYPGPSGTPYSLSHPYKIPANHYFMMGDNRGDSCDSRFWGPIPKSLMVGKVDLRIWPLTRFHFF